MKESKWLWRVAVVAFLAAVSVSAVDAASEASAGCSGPEFTFAQVAILVAVGAAWGDARTNRTRDREEFKEFRQEVHEFMKEVKGHDQ